MINSYIIIGFILGLALGLIAAWVILSAQEKRYKKLLEEDKQEGEK